MYELTKEFWKENLLHILNGEPDFMIENPALKFTRKTKAGDYDSISDEEYKDLLNECENIAELWQKLPKKAAADLLVDALKSIHLCTADTVKIIEMLSKYSFKQEKTPDSFLASAFSDLIIEEDELCNLTRSFDIDDWSPKCIHKYLDLKVYGQNEAKKAASLILYNHVEGRRSNALFCGPTGSGKTEIWRQLKKDYPKLIRIIDASRLSADGWKGSVHLRDVFENIPSTDLERYGLIVVFDEADKTICERIVGSYGTDFSALIQNSLLKMMDGDVLEFGAEDNRKSFTVDCSKVSVVFLGAFEKLLENKNLTSREIGFGASVTSVHDYSNTTITADDLIEAGMRREIAGRINRIASLNPLSADDFEIILKNLVIKELEENFKCHLTIDESCIQSLAEKAAASGLGVRYIKSCIMNALDDLIYEDPEAGNYYISL